MFYKGKTENNFKGISNLFAECFQESYDNNGSCLLDTSFLEYVHSHFDFGSMELGADDVLPELMCLNNSKKLDIDLLSPFLIKMCAPSFCGVLLKIFNLSLAKGDFLDNWKISHISPLYKKGNKCDISNYRPIAKTSTISKIFERIIKKKLVFITKHVISINQHGFSNGRSTVSNLATFSKFCIEALDDGAQVDVIYTDFSKAFDKVSHKVLLAKLYKLGFHSVFFNWLQSYLSNRLCKVVVENEFSNSFVAKSGVPQGSILGPLLFILFINDISVCLSNVIHLLYADDLTLFYKIKNVADTVALQNQLNLFVRWCKLNLLQLNVSKCVHVTYSRCRSPIISSFSLDNNIVLKMDNILDLGVMFDRKFSFINHINYIMPKAYAVLAFVKRNSGDFADPYTLKVLFTSYVRSKLEYAALIWNPCYAAHADRIERIQKLFLKFALRSINFTEPVSYFASCQLLGLKSLISRRKLLSMLFIFDLINANIDAPSLLSCIDFHVPSRSLRHQYLFSIMPHKSNFMLNEPITRTLILLNCVYQHDVTIDFSTPKSYFKNIVSSLV